MFFKTVLGHPPDQQLASLLIHNEEIKQVSSYKYLGVMIDATLSWTPHLDYICKKIQQRVYFLHRLRSFGASSWIIALFLRFCDTECVVVL